MIEINLIAQRRAAQQREQKIALSFFMLSVLFALGLVVILVGFTTRIGAKRGEIKSTKAKISKLLEQKKEIDLLEAEIAQKKPVVGLLERARGSERDWLLTLTDVSNAIPAGVWLTGVDSGTGGVPRIRSASGGGAKKAEKVLTLTLRGQARSQEAVGAYQEALQKTESIQDAYINSITSQTTGNEKLFQFELVATLSKMIGVERK